MTYNAKTEFPDWEGPALPQGWEDVSWRNDMCPCYKAPNGFGVWLDYPVPEQREFPELPRFTVFDYESNSRGSESGSRQSWDFDTFEAACAFIASATDGLPADVLATFDSIEGAAAWVAAMHRANLAFHWEDNALTIVRFDKQSAEPSPRVFTDSQAVLINSRRFALYDLEWPEGTCPCGVSLALEGHYLDNGVADFNSAEDKRWHLAELAKYRRLFPALAFKSLTPARDKFEAMTAQLDADNPPPFNAEDYDSAFEAMKKESGL